MNAQPMLGLVSLLHRVRDAGTAAELAFIAVNQTGALVPCRQAALWEEGRGVVAVTAVPEIDGNAPFALWLNRVCAGLGAGHPAGPLDAAALAPLDRDEWGDWLPPHGFWQPLPQGGGALLLVRDQPWTEGEGAVLAELAHAYGHALGALRRPSRWRRWSAQPGRRRYLAAAAAVILVAFCCLPVPLTVLAPADVVAAHPAVVRSPQDGVVDTVYVQPGDRVGAGKPLFDLDTTQVAGKIEVAEKSLAVAEAEWRQWAQQAVFDPQAKPRLAVAQGKREQQAAELDYYRTLLTRMRVVAPQDGIVVLEQPSEWIGRPVSIGERVLELAEERDTEIEAWLAPADVIALDKDAPVTVFLNVAPLSPVRARLTQLSYEASQRPDGTVAYRVRARIDGDGQEKPRLGLKGTARLSGERVALIYWALRRPLGAVRQALGL